MVAGYSSELSLPILSDFMTPSGELIVYHIAEDLTMFEYNFFRREK